MKILIYVLTCLCTGAVFAGSLGKYSVEESRSTRSFSSEIKPQVIDKKLIEQAIQKKALIERENRFYAGFENKVRSLSPDERRQWLAEYRQKLSTATDRDTINKKEVTHYSRLISILQKHIH